MTDTNGNDFREYRRLILSGLERANERLDKIDERITKLDKDLTALSVKMAIYGAASGGIAAAIVSAFISGVMG